jgi:hypothetical protein
MHFYSDSSTYAISLITYTIVAYREYQGNTARLSLISLSITVKSETSILNMVLLLLMWSASGDVVSHSKLRNKIVWSLHCRWKLAGERMLEWGASL